jgi:hypothetical protein
MEGAEGRVAMREYGIYLYNNVQHGFEAHAMSKTMDTGECFLWCK